MVFSLPHKISPESFLMRIKKTIGTDFIELIEIVGGY
jgi:hypothetical protein